MQENMTWWQWSNQQLYPIQSLQVHICSNAKRSTNKTKKEKKKKKKKKEEEEEREMIMKKKKRY